MKLKFFLGGILLFSFSFDIFVYQRHFTDTPLTLEDLDLLFVENGRGILYKSFPINKRIPTIRVTKQYISYASSQYNHYYVDLGKTFEEYLQKFSSKTKSTLNRKVNNLDKLCQTTDNWQEFSNEGEIKIFYDQARKVSEKTYQERLIDAGLPTSAQFIKSMLDLAHNNSVKGFILYYENKPISYIYCPIVNKNILVYRFVGYDQEYKKMSPGTVLQYKVLKKLYHDNKWKMFDFTEGDGDHKKLFATDYLLCADIYYFEKTLKNFIMVYFHYLFSEISKAMTSFSEKMKIKSRLKMMIRKYIVKHK